MWDLMSDVVLSSKVQENRRVDTLQTRWVVGTEWWFCVVSPVAVGVEILDTM
jgi:hypothetical protein